MSIQHTLSRDTGRVYLPRPKDSLITAYFPSCELLHISSIEMSSLPVVYGTVGRIEPLLDPAILGRFADLPQNGKPTRAVCRNMQLCYRCHPPSCKGVGVIKAQLQLAANVRVIFWVCREIIRGVRVARRHHAGSAMQDEDTGQGSDRCVPAAHVELRRLLHRPGSRCTSLSSTNIAYDLPPRTILAKTNDDLGKPL